MTGEQIVNYYIEHCHDGIAKDFIASDGSKMTYENLLKESAKFISKDDFDNGCIERVDSGLEHGQTLEKAIETTIDSFIETAEFFNAVVNGNVKIHVVKLDMDDLTELIRSMSDDELDLISKLANSRLN